MAEDRSDQRPDNYTPLPTQQHFHDACNGTGEFADREPIPYILNMGGVGSGKTVSAVAQGLHNSREWPGNVGVVGRLYATDLDSSTKQAYIDYMEEFGIPYEEVKSERLIKVLNPTTKPSKIYFWPLEESARLGSKEIGWAHIEEASELKDDQAFVRLKHRLRFAWKMPPLSAAAVRQKLKLRPRAPYRRMIFLTANPPNEDHWLAKWFPEPEMVAEGKRNLAPGHLLIQCNSFENKANLPPNYLEDLVATMPPSWVEVYIKGKYGFLATGSPVYQGFDEELHVKKLDWNRYRDVIRAWDFGRTHPCVVWSQIDQNGRWFVLRELMETNKILEDFIPLVKARSAEWFPSAHFTDCCDIAGTQGNDKSDRTSIQMLEDNGIHPRFRKCSRAVLGPDISRVQKMITKLIPDGAGKTKPALMVDESCILVKRGLAGGYQISKDGINPAEDGFYEHSMDCIKYTAANFLESESVQAARNIQIEGPRWGW
jgi:hypothetical protein